MKQGPTSFWEGKMMPSILRGSKKHNEALLAKQQENEKMKAKNALRNHQTQSKKATKTITPATANVNVAKTVVQVRPVGAEDLFEKARELLAKFESNSQSSASSVPEMPKAIIAMPLSSSTVLSTSSVSAELSSPQESRLYCHETLDSPPCSPVKAQPILLSPFSQAKVKARQLGVGLKDECRGMYDQAELESRIEKLAELNAKLRRSRQ